MGYIVRNSNVYIGIYVNTVLSFSYLKLPFISANPTKMVKHTQTICRQQPIYCLNVFDHFVTLVLKGL